MPEEFVDDDGTLSADIVFSEDTPGETQAEAQALWIGVRPGYDEHSNRLPEPTVWVQYQEQHMNSQLTGCVAISPEAWGRLDEAVRWRIAAWRELYEKRNIPAARAGADPDRDSAGTDKTTYIQPELPYA